jgi:nucleotide-binding universal stress UspA family protein
MPPVIRIVCPVDFSEPSRHALEHADALARWYRVPLVVVHALTPEPEVVPALELITVGTGTLAGEPVREPVHQAVHDFLADVVPDADRASIAVEVGRPASIIVKEAAVPGTLIVIGTHGRHGLERLMLGSVAEQVLRTVSCPVMTVPPRSSTTSHLPLKTLVCAVDFSPASEQALALALSMAKEGDAELTLLHVLENLSSASAPPHTREFYSPEFAGDRKRDAIAALQRMIPTDAAEWCTPQVIVRYGDPADSILSVAADTHADAIIMGVRHRGKLDQMAFGSTTHEVLRRATCPVITERS